MIGNGKRLMSVHETAEYLGISPRTIYNQTGRKSEKKFPVKFKRIGKLIKFDIKDVDRYIDSLTEEEPDQVVTRR